jgi:hypothetical protein
MITGVRAIRQDSLGGPEVLRVVEISGASTSPRPSRSRRPRGPTSSARAADTGGGKLVLTIA